MVAQSLTRGWSHNPAQCGAASHKPEDRDQRQNQESDAKLNEPPRCPHLKNIWSQADFPSCMMWSLEFYCKPQVPISIALGLYFSILQTKPYSTIFLMFIYFERERARERGRGRGRERGRERSPVRLHTVSPEPNMALDLTNHEIMTWAETKNWMLNRLSHPGVPWYDFLYGFKMFKTHLGVFVWK